METISLSGANGILFTADVAGDSAAPPVLLLHGGGQTRSRGARRSRRSGKGWHTFSVDLRGHGESQWAPNRDYSLDAFAADVHTVAREMSEAPRSSARGWSRSRRWWDRGDRATARVVPRARRRSRRASSTPATSVTSSAATSRTGSAAWRSPTARSPAYNGRDRRISRGSRRTSANDRTVGGPGTGIPVTGRKGSPDETRSTTLMNEERLEAARALDIPTLFVRARGHRHRGRARPGAAPAAQVIDVTDEGHMVAGNKNDLFNDAVVSFLDEGAGAGS